MRNKTLFVSSPVTINTDTHYHIFLFFRGATSCTCWYSICIITNIIVKHITIKQSTMGCCHCCIYIYIYIYLWLLISISYRNNSIAIQLLPQIIMCLFHVDLMYFDIPLLLLLLLLPLELERGTWKRTVGGCQRIHYYY
jgi:hypothetical protein